MKERLYKMRDRRIPHIILKLEQVWQRHPEWRLCQLIFNLHGANCKDIFYTKDEYLEEKLDSWLEKDEDKG